VSSQEDLKKMINDAGIKNVRRVTLDNKRKRHALNLMNAKNEKFACIEVPENVVDLFANAGHNAEDLLRIKEELYPIVDMCEGNNSKIAKEILKVFSRFRSLTEAAAPEAEEKDTDTHPEDASEG